MRQTGYLAGCAAYALTHNFPQLPRTHALAKRMQRGLEDINIDILSPAETCMVRRLAFVFGIGTISDDRYSQLFYDPSTIGVEYWEVVERAAALEKPIKINGSRIIMHIQTSPKAVEDFLDLMKSLKEEKAKAGWMPEMAPPKKQSPFRNVYIEVTKPT